jgi:hypothetical protein
MSSTQRDGSQPKRPKRRSAAKESQPRPPSEVPRRREHGDSYADVIARDDTFDGTSATHLAPASREPEEPSDSAYGTLERLEH